MKYTAAHWGSYEIGGETLRPLADDPAPSRIGKGWVSAARDKASRILRPAVRKGWLEGDRGAKRCCDSYIEISWDRAIDLATTALKDTIKTHGNRGIFGGSYGWSSAGRFHHAQSQMRRFLNLAGGCTRSHETYSHAAAEVLFPHILGLTNTRLQDQMTAMPLVSQHCDILLAVGGISARTAQITSSGTNKHEVGPWLREMLASGKRIICLSPRRADLEGAEWIPIRPGTDTAFLLALTYELVANGWEDTAFLARYTSGWERFKAYLTGATDGCPKSADWAAPICDVAPTTIRALARDLSTSKSMISLAWALQRAQYGEQPLWAGLALASALGQIGQAGTGYGFGYGATTPVGRAAKLIPWPSMPQGQNPINSAIPVARIADMLLMPNAPYTFDGEARRYPEIDLIWWTGGNPFHHHQDLTRLETAWQRPSTVIVNDHSWTATARRADLVLPATTPLERDDIMMNRRDPTLLYMSKLFEPMGEALDDYEIFTRLADKMGFAEAFTAGRSAQHWLRHLWEKSMRISQAHGFTLPDFETFKAEGRFDVPDATEMRIALKGFIDDPEQAPLATESGKITLFNRGIAQMNLASCPPHPSWLAPDENLIHAQADELHLLSGQPDTRLHAQNDRGSEAQADKIQGREAAYLHPDTAQAHGLREGQIIQLFNARGACLAGVRFDDGLRRDCIFLPTGAWFDPQEIGGQRLEVHGNPNMLTRDIGCSELSQGNIAHSCLVRIAPWDGNLPALSVDRPPPFTDLP